MSEYAPKTYRKTAPVKAMQWDGAPESTRAVLAWANGKVTAHNDESPVYLIVHTLEGPLRMNVGDWALQGDEGEFWPNRGDIFARSYEQISDEGAGDLAAARARIERLQEWKDSASDVMLGLQDVGKALGLPLGSSITGSLAAETAEGMKAAIARVEALADELAQMGTMSMTRAFAARRIRAALCTTLAEPERDEESGR